MHILITGGAGYIGSHVLKLLGERGNHEITVVDNLSTGTRKALLYGDFKELDLSDFSAVHTLMDARRFDAVLHFAAHIVVPESVENPIKYYMNNTANTVNLIQASVKTGVKYFIFSSTAAVYGVPAVERVTEETPLNPINPYGMSKLMSEQVLKDSGFAYKGFKYVILRYFNVAGADPDGLVGQNFPDATHLIKVAAQTALGKRDSISVFGTDFPTKDGTGIRDYIHVTDLASAHISALEYLSAGGSSNIFNCGYGKGFSVKEVLSVMKAVSGIDFKVKVTSRRPGDPAALIADNSKIRKTLNWNCRYDDLSFICKSALDWECMDHPFNFITGGR